MRTILKRLFLRLADFIDRCLYGLSTDDDPRLMDGLVEWEGGEA